MLVVGDVFVACFPPSVCLCHSSPCGGGGGCRPYRLQLLLRAELDGVLRAPASPFCLDVHFHVSRPMAEVMLIRQLDLLYDHVITRTQSPLPKLRPSLTAYAMCMCGCVWVEHHHCGALTIITGWQGPNGPVMRQCITRLLEEGFVGRFAAVVDERNPGVLCLYRDRLLALLREWPRHRAKFLADPSPAYDTATSMGASVMAGDSAMAVDGSVTAGTAAVASGPVA